MKPTQPDASGNTELSLGISKIVSALHDLKFGSVEITVHEGRIVQIERKEKHRLNLQLQESGKDDKAR